MSVSKRPVENIAPAEAAVGPLVPKGAASGQLPKAGMMNVEVVRTDGTREQHQIPKRAAFKHIYALIGCDCIDTVNLRDGRVMLVDDNGYDLSGHREHRDESGTLHIEIVPGTPRKPFNDTATELYHGVCRPGTTHRIVGDVAIVRDEDFA